MSNAIETNDNGKPYELPAKPAANATIEEKIAYLEACYAVHDRRTNDANQAFAVAFRRSL